MCNFLIISRWKTHQRLQISICMCKHQQDKRFFFILLHDLSQCQECLLRIAGKSAIYVQTYTISQWWNTLLGQYNTRYIDGDVLSPELNEPIDSWDRWSMLASDQPAAVFIRTVLRREALQQVLKLLLYIKHCFYVRLITCVKMQYIFEALSLVDTPFLTFKSKMFSALLQE